MEKNVLICIYYICNIYQKTELIMKILTYKINAFTKKIASGNPSAVCILTKPLRKNIMQTIASEMNVSETAFVYKINKGFKLRWFTPKTEVRLCGHATLAASYALWQSNITDTKDKIIFLTKSGIIKASRKNNLIRLTFPLYNVKPAKITHKLTKVLNIKPIFIGRTEENYIIVLNDENEIKQASPNFELISKLTKKGIIITSKSSTKNIDYVCRYFAPTQGINEDPVTGSIQSSLGPFWEKYFNKNKLTCSQLSERGGTIFVQVLKKNVIISGYAVILMKGYIYLT